MKNWFLYVFLFGVSCAFAVEPATPQILDPRGWSLEAGGQYTWMSFTTPPTFKGSTGGVQGKLTYQTPRAFFGQLRSIYNIGTLFSDVNSSRDTEWYSEFVAGYCFSRCVKWKLTPYVGIGIDFLTDHKKAYANISAIELKYRLYYAIFGLDVRYAWKDWSAAVQLDCFPTFNQYLSITGLSGAAWKMSQRVGAAVRIPVGYQVIKRVWIELTPYYRFLPIGSSHVLSLPHRNLNQWGAFLTLRCFL